MNETAFSKLSETISNIYSHGTLHIMYCTSDSFKAFINYALHANDITVTCVECSCTEGQYYPLVKSSNFYVTQMKEEQYAIEHGLVYDPPKPIHVALILNVSSVEAFDTVKDMVDALNLPQLRVKIDAPILKYKQVVNPMFADKDAALKAKHETIATTQREALAEFGIFIGFPVNAYATPACWLTDGESYMDFSECQIQVGCSFDSEMYKEIESAGLLP